MLPIPVHAEGSTPVYKHTFHISKIDVDTGKTYINWDVVNKKDGERHIVCFENTKGYFPMAYSPVTNSLYVPYVDLCLDMALDMSSPTGFTIRKAIPRPGSDPNAFAGLARIDMATGDIRWRYTQRAPTTGAVLTTAGGLVFWGDMNRRFRAFDAESGKILWETLVGGVVQNSTITYAVNGKQYIAVMTGDGGPETRLPLELAPDIKVPRGHNEIYVYALPDRK